MLQNGYITMDAIQNRLASLKASLNSMRATYADDDEFLMQFAGVAEEIEEEASKADDGHDHCLRWLSVRAELDQMLEDVGLSRSRMSRCRPL
jgi:hypothetical protein